MDNRKLLDFQINRLGYQFRNLDLLQEALTHTVDNPNSQFPCQSRKYDRLQVIGNPVIKFVVSQHVIQSGDKSASEGQLTKIKDVILNGTVQMRVGERLLQPTSRGGDLYEFIRVNTGSKLNFKKVANGASPKIPYKKFVRALMGAVYLDAGGIAGDGIEMASKVFAKIWEDVNGDKTEDIQVSFPPPSKEIATFWERNGMNEGFVERVEESIGVSLVTGNSYLLSQALIHKSFYDTLTNFGISKNQYLPDYQRLEFLGDSVLGLVVAELVWLEEDPKYLPDGLDHKIKNRIESEKLLEIFKRLGLRHHVKMKAGGIQNWSNEDDIVESIVGAVFVDGGGPAAIQFIKSVFGDFQEKDTCQPNLEDLEAKLGYKFQNNQFLIRALTHPSILPGAALKPRHSSKKQSIFMEARPALSYVGKSWIKFHVSDYILRTCSPDDTKNELESRRELLCSQPVLQRIGSHLQLSKYFNVTSGQLRSGMEPFILYQDIIHAICGAVFKDMQEAKIKMSFGNVFYRLWNPFFLESKLPVQRVLENFPQNSGSLFDDYELLGIEEKVHYSFNNLWLLGEALTSSVFRRVSQNFVGDSVKFLFIGEPLVDLALSVYIAILWFIEIQGGSPQSSGRSLHLQTLHSITMSDCMELGQDFFQTESLRRNVLFPSGLDQHHRQSLSVSDEEIIKCLLGAVYFDMEENSADGNFSEWKDYFINTCKFITGKREE